MYDSNVFRSQDNLMSNTKSKGGGVWGIRR